MKTRIILAIGLGIAWCSAASAEEPLTPGRLGVVDAVISFCREFAPAGDGAYRALKVSFIGKQSDRTLDAMEGTSEYRQTFVLIRGVIEEAPRDAMRRHCYAAIGQGGRDNGH